MGQNKIPAETQPLLTKEEACNLAAFLDDNLLRYSLENWELSISDYLVKMINIYSKLKAYGEYKTEEEREAEELEEYTKAMMREQEQSEKDHIDSYDEDLPFGV